MVLNITDEKAQSVTFHIDIYHLCIVCDLISRVILVTCNIYGRETSFPLYKKQIFYMSLERLVIGSCVN